MMQPHSEHAALNLQAYDEARKPASRTDRARAAFARWAVRNTNTSFRRLLRAAADGLAGGSRA